MTQALPMWLTVSLPTTITFSNFSSGIVIWPNMTRYGLACSTAPG